MVLRFLLLLAALFALPAQALANDLIGHWAFRIDDATIFIFEISEDADGDWQGSWTRPASFRSNGVVFAELTGSEELEAMAALEFAGLIELSFEDPRPNAVPDIFRFRHVAENRAELTYVGTDLAPYPLVRVAPGSRIGPFDASRIYDSDNAVTEADSLPAPVLEEVPAEEAAEPQAETQSERPRVDAGFLDDL
ncbi:MAG: hypothetical protein JY451_04270 [Erythrobacter sp.]|nr:MAG: hypothetical protein JY451_04270 [Erythrobacter sp.]